MTSKIVVNNIEADAGVSTVFFNSDIGATDGTLNVDGNLNVDGVITYEDVTSVDSVGIITAQAGIHVTGGVQVATGATITGSTNTIIAETAGLERLRIDSSGRTHLGDRSYNNNNTYFGLAQVNICGPDNPPTSMTRAGAYLDIGGTESLVNSMQYISFGFASTHTYKPAFIGYQTINAGAAEYGDIFFATRNVTSDTQPTERLRITSGGTLLQTGGDLVIDSTNNGYGGLRIVDDSGGDYTVNYIAGRNQGATAHVFKRSGRTQGTSPWANSGGDIEFARISRGGIAFGGDTAAANTLDDYEEGTWTPNFTNCTYTPTVQFGRYTKIGRYVYCTITIDGNSMSGSGIIGLEGLPFSSTDVSDDQQRSAWHPANGGHMVGLSINDARFRVDGTTMQGVKGATGNTSYMSANQLTSGTFQFTGDFSYYTG